MRARDGDGDDGAQRDVRQRVFDAQAYDRLCDAVLRCRSLNELVTVVRPMMPAFADEANDAGFARQLLGVIHPDRLAQARIEDPALLRKANDVTVHVNGLREEGQAHAAGEDDERPVETPGEDEEALYAMANPRATWEALKEAETDGVGVFANLDSLRNVIVTRDTTDAWVFECGPDRYRTSNAPAAEGWFDDADGAGIVTLNRIFVTFAALTAEGRGLGPGTDESATFTRIRELVFDPIASCIQKRLGGGTRVRFFVVNAIPTTAYAGDRDDFAHMHEEFDVSDNTSRLGSLSRAEVQSGVEQRVARLRGVGMSAAVFSTKVRNLLSANTRQTLETNDGWTFDAHPTALLVPDEMALFERLVQEREEVFGALKRCPTLIELVDFKRAARVVNDEDTATNLQTLVDELRRRGKTVVDFIATPNVVGLFKWQLEAVQELVNKYLNGDRGAIVTLDVGLGKTHVAHALLAVTLLSGAANAAVMCVESHAAEHALQEFESFLQSFFPERAGQYLQENRSSVMDAVTIVTSGHTQQHRGKMESAFQALRGRRAVVIVDEVSRYVGCDPASKGNILLAAEAAHLWDDAFVVGMTATPVTAHLTRLVNVLLMAGVQLIKDAEAHVTRSCMATVIALANHLNRRHQQNQNEQDGTMQVQRVDVDDIGDVALVLLVDVNKHVAACDELAKRVTVGGVTMTPEALRELHDLLTQITIERTVALFKVPEGSEAIFGGIRTSKAFGMVAELHPEGAAAAFDVNGVAPSVEASPLTRALLAILHDQIRDGKPVLVFFPSSLRAAMHATYHEVRACASEPDGVHVIDGSTAEAVRTKLFEALNNEAGNTTAGRTCLLFVTTETGAYGRNCFDVDTAVFVSTGWTDATTVQAFGRVVRASSAHCIGKTKKLKLMMPINGAYGEAYQRFARSGARGQLFECVAPGRVHADRAPIVINGAVDRPPRSENARNALRRSIEQVLLDRLFNDEPNAHFVEVVYDEFVGVWNDAVTEAEGTERVNLRFAAAAAGGGGGRGDAAGGAGDDADDDEEREGTGEEEENGDAEEPAAGANGRRQETPGRPHQRTSRIRASVARAFASRASTEIPPLPAVQNPDDRATRIADQMRTIVAQLNIAMARGDRAPRPSSLNDDTGYFIVKDTASPLRRQLLFASALAQVALRNNKPRRRNARQHTASSAYFTFLTPEDGDDDARGAANRDYGTRNEATVVEHVQRKLGNPELVAHIGEYTRVHPEFRRLLATLDAITTSGIVLEIKCVPDYDAYIHAIACASDGENQKYTDYVDQVRAQLEVFDLELGLLCLSHVTPGNQVLSVELPVFRDRRWFEDQKPLYELLLADQERFLRDMGRWENVD